MYEPFTYLVKFIPMYFYFCYCNIINGIVLTSISNLLSRNVTDFVSQFCMLQLYWIFKFALNFLLLLLLSLQGFYIYVVIYKHFKCAFSLTLLIECRELRIMMFVWQRGETEILKVNLMAELGWFRSPELELCGLFTSFDIHNLLKGQKLYMHIDKDNK